MTDLAAAAIAYAASNIAVFPLRPRMKMPYGRTTALYMAAADVALTTARWAGEARLPLKPIEALREGAQKAGRTVSDAELLKPVLAGAYANIGIATGAPAGFWVLDLDGPDAVLWLECKEAEHGPLPVTPTSLTARGRHLCFAWCERSSAHPEIANRSGMEGAPVDVRGQGGYILAPPSVHPGDEKKGVPPGHVYRWAPGLSPADLDFARAPDWLITLVKPVEATASSGPVTQRAPTLGRASRFGELILDRVVATITSARVGSRDSTLYAESCGIGALVAGGEIEEAYARSTLEAAGRVHVPDAMSEAQLVRQVERALAYGAAHPRSARERSQRPVRAPLASRPRYDAQRALDPEAYWNEGASALGSSAVAYWLDRLGLDPRGLPCALDRMRFHPEAPDHDGECRPMLLAPMSEAGRGPVRALAMFDLETASTRPAGFMGRSLDRRAMMLTSMAGPGPIVVGLDFADTWVLASRLPEVPSFGMNWGIKANTLGIPLQRGGNLNATLGLIGQGETRAGSTAAGTPDALDMMRFSSFAGLARRLGVPIGDLVSGQFNVSNGLDPVPAIRGDGRISGVDEGMLAVTGQVGVRYSGQEFQDLAENGAATELEFGWTIPNTNFALRCLVHSVYLPKSKLPITGPTGIQADYAWQAAEAAGLGRTATITLVNDVASY